MSYTVEQLDGSMGVGAVRTQRQHLVFAFGPVDDRIFFVFAAPSQLAARSPSSPFVCTQHTRILICRAYPPGHELSMFWHIASHEPNFPPPIGEPRHPQCHANSPSVFLRWFCQPGPFPSRRKHLGVVDGWSISNQLHPLFVRTSFFKTKLT